MEVKKYVYIKWKICEIDMIDCTSLSFFDIIK